MLTAMATRSRFNPQASEQRRVTPPPAQAQPFGQAQKMAVLVFGLVLAAGFYASWGTISSLWEISAASTNVLMPPSADSPAPATPAVDTANAPLTGIAATFSNSLMTLKDGTNTPVGHDQLAPVKYWAFYYSASWCPPCRAFTPGLVNFYNNFKPSHPQFELIFVSQDNSADDMLSYMRDDGMPWPAVYYADIHAPELNALKYCGQGIPCLVLVDAQGQVLSDSFQGSQYLGPQHVLDDIQTMVK